ncbi:MAG: metal ABC transporter substrate-binding protein [Verrucomicrobiae bacterium]|nr:metal ABC transporter substrate-binding protein [Verrucomicrobiae bacterium]
MKKKFLSFCIGILAWSSSAEKIKILTTFSPIYCFTKNVAGDWAEVINLLPDNVGPHEYMMRPQDAKKIAATHVIIFNGLGLEEFLEKAFQINSKAKRIDASVGIETINNNPHTWLDPLLAIEQVKNIAKGLEKIDPEHATYYQKNAKKYIAQLKKLHENYVETLKPLNGKKMIAFHDAFPYLAHRYGIKRLGVFEEFPGKEPTPKYLAHIIDVIRKEKISVLFSEPQYNPQLLKQIAVDTGVKTAELDTMETGSHSVAFYEEVAKNNLKTLQETFR